MPHYYFDVDNGVCSFRDDEGSEMPDIQAARNEAISVLPDLARGVMLDGDRREMRTVVRNEDGQIVFKATLTLVAEWVSVPDTRRWS